MRQRFSSPTRVLAVVAGSAVSWAALAPTALAQNAAPVTRTQRGVVRAVGEAEPGEYRFKVDTSLQIYERSIFEVGGYTSMTYVNFDDDQNNNRTLWQPQVTLFGRAVIDGAHTFFVRGTFAYQAFTPGDSFNGDGDQWVEPILDRYWYEFDMNNAQAAQGAPISDVNANIRLGRQFVDWGAGLALSEVLYAARGSISFQPDDLGTFSFEGLAGVTPPDEAVTDFDASRKQYDYDTMRGYFGGLLRYTTRSDHQMWGYVLAMPDFNDDSTPREPIGVNNVNFDYDAWYLSVGAEGAFNANLRYLGEFVYELGESQSDPTRGPQASEPISAWAARGMLAWYFRDDHDSSVYAETFFGSGDTDRQVTTDTIGGNRRGTTDYAFNSLGFSYTGLAFAPAISNVIVLRFGGMTTPFPGSGALGGLQVGLDLNITSKIDADAPIEEPTNDDMFLGVEPDLVANWRLTSDFSLVGRYGVFFPGAAIENNEARQFIYLGASLSF